MKKTLTILTLIAIMAGTSLTVLPAKAETVSLMASYTGGTGLAANIYNLFPNGTYGAGSGEVFNCTVTSYLVQADFVLRKYGDPTFTFRAYLWSSVGAYGQNSACLPGTLLATSTTQYNASTSLTINWEWKNFTFNYDHLTANTQYFITVQPDSYYYGVTTNYVGVRGLQPSTVDGNEALASNAGNGGSPPYYWIAESNLHIDYRAWTSDTDLGPTPTPTRTPTVTPTPDATNPPGQLITNENATALVNYIAALMLLLAPSALLAFLFHMGKLGFLAGLPIGSVLAYLILPATFPLWLTFTVIVGSVGLLIFGDGLHE